MRLGGCVWLSPTGMRSVKGEGGSNICDTWTERGWRQGLCCNGIVEHPYGERRELL
jgi:hypothetical protein